MTMNYFTKKYLSDTIPNASMTQAIQSAIEEAIEKYPVWKKHSQELYKEKFCQKVSIMIKN